MAQLIVRNLEDDIRDKLRAMAAEHGRSMEEEVREILRSAVLCATGAKSDLGSRLAARFRGCGLTEPIAELRGQSAAPAGFGPDADAG